MQNLLYNISQVLGITILHSLWQGLIILITLRLFLLLGGRLSSAVKYGVSYAALCTILGWFIATLFNELERYEWLSTIAIQISPLTVPAITNEVNTTANKLYFNIAQYMPYLAVLYIAGLAFNTIKLSLTWNNIYRIKQNSSEAGLEGTISRLSHQLNITKFVKAAFSEWVDVPCITGFFKPVILLPVSLTCNLSALEIESILLHELAHIKRNDYLLNFIQQVTGILLFFNPFARLVARIINRERENCCDDIVVKVTGSPLIYAQALLNLEENKQYRRQLALAAATKKYELLNRIERIMKTKTTSVNIRPVLITVLALTCAISSIAWFNPEVKDGKIVIKNAPAIHKIAAVILPPSPTVPEPVKSIHKHLQMAAIKTATDTNQATMINDTILKTRTSIEEDKVWNKQVEDARKASMGLLKQINTPEFKKMQEQIRTMVAKQNGPEARKHFEETMKRAMEIAKNAPDSAMRERLENTLDRMNTRLNNNDGLENLNMDYNSPEFKKATKRIAERYNSPEFKEKIKKLAEVYNSPEFQKKMEELNKKISSPEFQKKMEEAINSQEFQKKMEELNKKINSPEFKKKMEKAINNSKF